MVDWLGERAPRRRLDRPARLPARAAAAAGRRRAPDARSLRAGAAASSSGLDGEETRRAVHAGWRVLKLAGIEPDGFVAPAYAYTAALRRALGQRFRWWAELLRVHRTQRRARALRARRRSRPAWSLAARGPVRRVPSPRRWCAPARCCPTSTLRLDLHPADLRTRATCSRWSGCSRARARAGPAITYQRASPGVLSERPGAGGSARSSGAVNSAGSKRLDGAAAPRSRGASGRTGPRSCAAARSG